MIDLGSGCSMVLGDCIEGMRQLADKGVDCVITDPPYSRDLYARTRTNKGSGREGTRIRPASDMTAKLSLASESIGCIDDILDDVAAHFVRIVRRWMLIFSDLEIGDRWRAALGKTYVRSGVWIKPSPMPQMSGDRPAQGFELCTIGHAVGRKRWNGGGRAATWIVATCQGNERPDHPCPKPLDLMLQLVADFTDPGDLVLDAFAGSGTTGVACRQLGRRFIGFERDEKYFEIACRRIRGESARVHETQLDLLGGIR